MGYPYPYFCLCAFVGALVTPGTHLWANPSDKGGARPDVQEGEAAARSLFSCLLLLLLLLLLLPIIITIIITIIMHGSFVARSTLRVLTL